jgi:hypothetical protein
VSYNRLENPSKNLWCNRQAKWDSQKLVNLAVPDKSEKFPGSQRNWDMEISVTPSFVGQSESYISDFRQGEVPSSVRGSSISTTEKSNRGNSSD